MSAMASVAPRESNSVPPPPPKLYIGMPSMTYSAFDDCEMDLLPRRTTFVAPPTPDDEALIVTPATLPESEFMKLASLTSVISEAATCCTLYERAFSWRLMPRAVTTTCSISDEDSCRVTSNDVREPTGTVAVS